MRTRGLLQKQNHPGHRRILPALSVSGSLLQLAAISRRSSPIHESHGARRNPRSGKVRTRGRRSFARTPRHLLQQVRQESRSSYVGSPSGLSAPPDRMARLPSLRRHGISRSRNHQSLPAEPADDAQPTPPRAISRKMEAEGAAIGHRGDRGRGCRRGPHREKGILSDDGDVRRTAHRRQRVVGDLHMASTHGRGRSSLFPRQPLLREGRPAHDRSSLRQARSVGIHRLFAPQDRHDARRSPLRVIDPALQGRSRDRGDQGGIPEDASVRSHTHSESDMESREGLHGDGKTR
mmetsp:Transcript_7025/g.17183  ORF Transcript_7025/g.17183 Transcript_7025/m.17183 type:complete len:292 (-) Transcript_7025:100-975(-)